MPPIKRLHISRVIDLKSYCKSKKIFRPMQLKNMIWLYLTVIQNFCPTSTSVTTGGHIMVRRTAFMKAAVNYYMPVCHMVYHGQFMAYQQYGCILRHTRQYVIQSRLKALVYLTQRLVQHKHPRSGHKGSPKQRTLQLSSRQHADRLTAMGLKPH